MPSDKFKPAIFTLDKALLRELYDKIQHTGWGRVANTA